MPKTTNMKQTKYTEPLFIDTTLEYAIDRSRFPGIDNGEPMLLVHSSTNCPCTQTHTSIIAPAADHELYTLIDTLAEVVTATEQIQPGNESNTCCFGLSPVSPLQQSQPEDIGRDVISDYPKDRDYQSMDSPLNTLDVLFDFSSSSSDSHPSALLDDQLFPSFYNPHDPDYLFDDFSTICDVDLCIIGMKTRKRRHSTVSEDSPKRRRTCCSCVADFFHEEADLRWSS